MSLPINILELVHGKVVEWERLEFKEGWNHWPLPPVTTANLQQRRVIARDYRNRRIGDFLKELKLTEGKATGFPLIKDEMAKNGSPVPIFYTDEYCTLFLTTLPCHPELILAKPVTKRVTKKITNSEAKLSKEVLELILNEGVDFQQLGMILSHDISDVRSFLRELIVTNSVIKLVTKSGTKSGTMSVLISGAKLLEIIDLLQTDSKTRAELLDGIGFYNKTGNFNNYIKSFVDIGVIELTIPDKPNSKFQKYRLTAKGKQLLK